jgi:hypothetical protein
MRSKLPSAVGQVTKVREELSDVISHAIHPDLEFIEITRLDPHAGHASSGRSGLSHFSNMFPRSFRVGEVYRLDHFQEVLLVDPGDGRGVGVWDWDRIVEGGRDAGLVHGHIPGLIVSKNDFAEIIDDDLAI